MTAESKITTNHDTIKSWVEKRNGQPAIVNRAESNGSGNGGLLKIKFSDESMNNLKSVSWDEFFKTFDSNNLAMVYQEQTSGGNTSRFNKFVDRDKIYDEFEEEEEMDDDD